MGPLSLIFTDIVLALKKYLNICRQWEGKVEVHLPNKSIYINLFLMGDGGWGKSPSLPFKVRLYDYAILKREHKEGIMKITILADEDRSNSSSEG